MRFNKINIFCIGNMKEGAMDTLEEDAVDEGEEDFVRGEVDQVLDLGLPISLGGGPRSLRRATAKR